jgi:phage shock protein PspC (stress-responsive transcriptional regulator)
MYYQVLKNKIMKIKKIRRNMTDRVLAGVCSGIAHTFNFNPLWLRLLFVFATIYLFPWAIVVYLIAAIVIPKENVAFEDIKYKKFNRIKNHKLIGGVCTGLQDYFKIDVVLLRLAFIALIPAYGIGVIMYLTLWAISPMIELKKREVEKTKLDDENVIVEDIKSDVIVEDKEDVIVEETKIETETEKE